MASWYSSWLPGLPSLNFALPSSLQGRFISFVLRKSLGHFLSPGQLDFRQIDSQIGSGFVQINDLELDNEVCSVPLIRRRKNALTFIPGYKQSHTRPSCCTTRWFHIVSGSSCSMAESINIHLGILAGLTSPHFSPSSHLKQ